MLPFVQLQQQYHTSAQTQAKPCITCWVREVCVAEGILVMAISSSSTSALEPISRSSDVLAASVLPRRTSQ